MEPGTTSPAVGGDGHRVELAESFELVEDLRQESPKRVGGKGGESAADPAPEGGSWEGVREADSGAADKGAEVLKEAREVGNSDVDQNARGIDIREVGRLMIGGASHELPQPRPMGIRTRSGCRHLPR